MRNRDQSQLRTKSHLVSPCDSDTARKGKATRDVAAVLPSLLLTDLHGLPGALSTNHPLGVSLRAAGRVLQIQSTANLPQDRTSFCSTQGYSKDLDPSQGSTLFPPFHALSRENIAFSDIFLAAKATQETQTLYRAPMHSA